MTDGNTNSLRTPLLSSEDNQENDEEAAVDETEQEQPESGSVQSAEDDTNELQLGELSSNSEEPLWYKILHSNLLPDSDLFVQAPYLSEGSLPLKLLKFIGLTVATIALLHTFVSNNALFGSDRDKKLHFWQIVVFEGNYIVSDSIIFFMVGRLWKQRGVDHLAWILVVLLCNVYYEGQQFVSWLRYSVTMYSMHCLWPWQLWIFAGTILPMIFGVVFLHAQKAWKEGHFVTKLFELAFFALFYLGPTISSPYFHFHHWFAGWLLGMHCNYDVWWSRAAMAWCWGMYVNGIAVYGRDPILTCEYAYFVSTDNRCPFVDKTLEIDASYSALYQPLGGMDPAADWRNCSAHGYHL